MVLTMKLDYNAIRGGLLKFMGGGIFEHISDPHFPN